MNADFIRIHGLPTGECILGSLFECNEHGDTAGYEVSVSVECYDEHRNSLRCFKQQGVEGYDEQENK